MIRRNDEVISNNGNLVSPPVNSEAGMIPVQEIGRIENELPQNDSPQESESSSAVATQRDIFESNDCYYKYTRGRNPDLKRISNVVFRAEAKVETPDGWFFQCMAKKQSGDTARIILRWNDFQSGEAFKRALSKQGLFEFYGNSIDTTEIQGILSDQNPPTKMGLKTHGIHQINGRWVYTEGSQAIDSMGPATDIVSLLAAPGTLKVSDLLNQADISPSMLREISLRIHRFNDKTITFPILGFIGYCFLKERLSGMVNQRSPILLIQGEPGTGKSETISRIIQPMFCSDLPLTNIADCTEFTAAINSSSTNIIPICYDEWKLASVSKPQKRIMDRMILATYSGTPLLRGQGNSRVLDMRFSAPMILAGEMTNDSPSIKHRMVELYFSYAKRKGTDECFTQLASLPLGACGKGLLLHSLSICDDQIHMEFVRQKDRVTSQLNDRFSDNAALLRMGLWLFIDYLRAHGIDHEGYEAGYAVIDSVINEMLVSSKITNVERILEDFSTMAAQGVLKRNEDYEVKDDTLKIKISPVYAKYERWAKRQATAEPIGKRSFLQQITDKNYFRGKMAIRIGGKECHGIKVSLSDLPGEVSLDGFREEGAHHDSTGAEEDDDISWQDSQGAEDDIFLPGFEPIEADGVGQGQDPLVDEFSAAFPPIETTDPEQSPDTADGIDSEPNMAASPSKPPVPIGWVDISRTRPRIVPGDEVEYWEGVFEGKYPDAIFQGVRQIVGRVLKESYGVKTGRHILTMEVQSSHGTKALEAGKQIQRHEKSLYNHHGDTRRKIWNVGSSRDQALEVSDRLSEETEQRRYQESAKPRHRRKPMAKKSEWAQATDENGQRIFNLTDSDRTWIEQEWYRDIAYNKDGRALLEKWVLDSQWIPLSGKNSKVVIGDIIQYYIPIYSGRYPKGRLQGFSIVIAEVVKIGRKLYHLRLLTSSGCGPRSKSDGSYKHEMSYIHYWRPYRLPWKDEEDRRSK